MADLIPPMLIKLQADVSELKVGLAQAENAIKGVDKSVQTASTGMSNFVGKVKQIGASLGIAFAGTQVLQFGRDVIAQAQEAEAQQQRLYQLMKVGTGATDEQIASLNAQAEALQKVGVVTAGNITQTQSQLATFNLQTDTIKALTPAILDYVTAEKGATAGADEFKQMTNGLAQALNGNFGSLTRVGFVLDENTKKQISSGTEAQRAAAIVEVLNSTYKDFNAELRNTPEGRMQVLRNDFDQLKEDLGKKLLPALKIVTDFLTDQLIPGLRTFGTFLKNNSTVIITLTGAILGGVVAYKAYLAIQKLVLITTTVMKVAQVLFTGATLASIASTNGLAASMLALNAAMRNNPIGIIVTAIGLLVAGFVIAYKKSETFRNGVAIVAKAVLSYVAFMVRAWGEMITIIMKVITGPMRLFLGVMSKLPGVGNAAKAGLKLVNGAIEGVGNFAEKTANKIEGLKAKVDSFTAAANKSSETIKDANKKDENGGVEDDGGGSLTDKEKKAREKYLKDVAAANKKYVALQDKFAEIKKEAAEKTAKAEEERSKDTLKAYADYAETRLKLQNDYNERISSASSAKEQAEIAARKKNTEELIDIEKDYDKKRKELETDLQKTLKNIREQAAEKSADLISKAADKQASIIQTSIDRLRNAFASKTGFDLAASFKESGSAAGLIDELKAKLQGAKDLQANAAALAGQGYSQTFIEEVVKNGPEAGNAIAEALKNASPEATKELKALYAEVEKISNTGLDQLAQTMNSGGKLATDELMKQFNEVGADLAQALAVVNTEMQASLAEATANFDAASAEAKATRDERISESLKKLQDALADATTEYNKAIAEAQKTLNAGLAESEKTLTDALTSIQDNYNEAITAIAKDTKDKLLDLQKDIQDTLDLMTKLKMDTSGITKFGATVKGAGGASAAEWAAGMTTSYLSSIRSTMVAVETYMRLIATTRNAVSKADYETKLAAVMKNVANYVAQIAALNPGKDVNAILAAAGITIPNMPSVVPPPTPTPAPTPTPTPAPTPTITQNFTTTAIDPSDVYMYTLSAIKYGAAITVQSTGIAKPITTVGAYDK